MKNCIYFIVLIFIISNRIYSITIDTSFVNQLIQESDSEKETNYELALEKLDKALLLSDSMKYLTGSMNSLINIAKIKDKHGMYKEAKTSFLRALDIATELDSINKIAEISIGLSSVYKNFTSYDSAMLFINNAKEIFEGQNNKHGLAKVYTNSAGIYRKQGDYKQALECYHKAADIYEKLNISNWLGTTYTHIANEYLDIQEFEGAIKYYKKSIIINEKEKDFRALTLAYMNLASCYKQMDSTDQVVRYYDLAFQIAEENNYPDRIAQIYMNKANFFSKQNQLYKALENYDKSIKICKDINLEYGIMLNYLNKAEVYRKLKQHEKAIDASLTALEFIDKLKLPKEEYHTYRILSEIYKEIGNYKESLFYYEKFYLVKDSLMNETKQKEILALQEKFETAQKNKEILSLKNSAYQKEALFIQYIAISLIILFTILFLYSRLRKKKTITEKEQIIAQQNLKLARNELDTKKRELTTFSMQIAKQNELSKNVIKNLSIVIKEIDIEDRKKIRPILKQMEFGNSMSSYWVEFEKRFNEVHTGFLIKIIQDYPNLTKSEIRVICLLKLNLSSKEVAETMQRNFRTIENTRTSIRKKMGFTKDQNLAEFIISL